MKNGDYILVVAPDNYPGFKYRGKYCYEHHLVYWENFGILPNENQIIHHKDKNKHNNDISNLELIDESEHLKRHGNEVLQKLVLLKCPWCSKLFVRDKRHTHIGKNSVNQSCTCCCRHCSGKFSSLKINNLEEYNMRKLKNILLVFDGKLSNYQDDESIIELSKTIST